MPLPGAWKGFQDYLVLPCRIWPAQAEQIESGGAALQLQPSPLDQMAAPGGQAPEAAAAVSPGVGLVSARTKALISDPLAAPFKGQPDFYADPWKCAGSIEPSAHGPL